MVNDYFHTIIVFIASTFNFIKVFLGEFPNHSRWYGILKSKNVERLETNVNCSKDAYMYVFDAVEISKNGFGVHNVLPNYHN